VRLIPGAGTRRPAAIAEWQAFLKKHSGEHAGTDALTFAIYRVERIAILRGPLDRARALVPYEKDARRDVRRFLDMLKPP
jgi:hypothetical protein